MSDPVFFAPAEPLTLARIVELTGAEAGGWRRSGQDGSRRAANRPRRARRPRFPRQSALRNRSRKDAGDRLPRAPKSAANVPGATVALVTPQP